MGHRILLIDESAMLRRIAANILQAQPGHYEVVVATRAVEGFAMACAGNIDLVLLDSRIAGAGGIEVCHRLRQEPRTSRIPVVLMVGQGSEHATSAVLPENAVDTLVKPFAPEELSGMVNAIFGFTRAGSNLTELRASLHPTNETPWPPQDTVGGIQSTPAWPDRALPASDSRRTDNQNASVHELGDHVAPSGGTRLTSLRAVLHSTSDAGLTGVLRLRMGEEPATEVLFDQGRLVVLSTRDARTYASRAAAVMPAKVSAATLNDAVAEQAESGTPFLLTLGTCGLLSKSSAIALLDQFGHRQFARLWPQLHRPALHYEFEPLDALPNYALRLAPFSMSLDEWLLASTRQVRAEEVSGLLRHEGTVGTPFFLPGGEEILRSLPLNDGEKAFFRLVNPRSDLPIIARSLGITQDAVYLLLFRFRCLEAMGYRPAPAAFVMTPRSYLRRVLPLDH